MLFVYQTPSTHDKIAKLLSDLRRESGSIRSVTIRAHWLLLDTDAQLLTQASSIYQQSVIAKAMPLGNLTGMSDAERDKINRWFNAGAKP